ncbi:hypothetical protein LINPERHAP1_LOCUS78 [Linum perenne]
MDERFFFERRLSFVLINQLKFPTLTTYMFVMESLSVSMSESHACITLRLSKCREIIFIYKIYQKQASKE